MLHCHEVWQYNEETSIQWLRGFAALCRDCHDVKHILFNRDTARQKELMRHFIAVNRISPEEAEQYLQAASQRQHRLDQKDWKVNYGDYNCWMPALTGKQQRQRHARFLRPHSKSNPSPDTSLDAGYF
jgi:glutaredoxin